MGCFDNYIGILTTDTSSTGLYSKHVGINPAMAEGLAQPVVYATGVEMLRDKLDFSVKVVSQEIRKFLYKHFRFDAQIDMQRIGKYDDSYHATTDCGLYIKKDINSILSKIYLKQVRLLTDQSGAKTVTITDGNEVTTYPVTMVAGEEQVLEIGYTANRDEIYITWDAQGAEGDIDCNGVYFTAQGWDGAIYTDLHYGIIADVSVICCENTLMCILAKNLGTTILYKYAEEVFAEAQLTDGLNYFTLADIEYEKFEEKFKFKYENSLQTFLKGLPQMLCSLDAYCIKCNQTRYTETI